MSDLKLEVRDPAGHLIFQIGQLGDHLVIVFLAIRNLADVCYCAARDSEVLAHLYAREVWMGVDVLSDKELLLECEIVVLAGDVCCFSLVCHMF